MHQPSSKRFRSASPLDLPNDGLTNSLRLALTFTAQSFHTSRSRNLDIMNSTMNRLYGLMTYYDGFNFCWVQPGRNKNMWSVAEYDRYLRKINDLDKSGKLVPIERIEVGMDCIVRYNADRHCYREIITEEPMADQWLVFFPDYGNFQRSTRDQIASIVEESCCSHYDAPIQAVCCRLYNVMPRLPSSRPEIDMRLENFFVRNTETFLDVKVKNARPNYIADCDLFIADKGEIGDAQLYKRHIGQSLVDEDLATFADPIAAYSIKMTEEMESS